MTSDKLTDAYQRGYHDGITEAYETECTEDYLAGYHAGQLDAELNDDE